MPKIPCVTQSRPFSQSSILKLSGLKRSCLSYSRPHFTFPIFTIFIFHYSFHIFPPKKWILYGREEDWEHLQTSCQLCTTKNRSQRQAKVVQWEFSNMSWKNECASVLDIWLFPCTVKNLEMGILLLNPLAVYSFSPQYSSLATLKWDKSLSAKYTIFIFSPPEIMAKKAVTVFLARSKQNSNFHYFSSIFMGWNWKLPDILVLTCCGRWCLLPDPLSPQISCWWCLCIMACDRVCLCLQGLSCIP